jgi:hypothetical protein
MLVIVLLILGAALAEARSRSTIRIMSRKMSARECAH